ncbi:PaaI family thioesterase [Sneathiella limimaris]|uniref:PaaI family thioesterase n=1 Tax=Sneathiella limimaris TaxID=1964213 RepID=UPI00146AA211|nr:PaaI family thioesterase [Sneathiella limimaris]
MDRIDQALYQRLQPIIDAQVFLKHLGVQIVELQPGRCEISLDYDQRWSQQDGFFHGGIVGTLADNSAGMAGASTMPEGRNCLTAEYKLNFIAPAKGETLIARANVIKAGRTLTVAESNIFIKSGSEERQVATALATLISV